MTARARWRDRTGASPPAPTLTPTGRAAMKLRRQQGRINLALSLCNQRDWAEEDKPTIDLIKRALTGAPIPGYPGYEDTS